MLCYKYYGILVNNLFMGLGKSSSSSPPSRWGYNFLHHGNAAVCGGGVACPVAYGVNNVVISMPKAVHAAAYNNHEGNVPVNVVVCAVSRFNKCFAKIKDYFFIAEQCNFRRNRIYFHKLLKNCYGADGRSHVSAAVGDGISYRVFAGHHFV